MTLPCTIRGGYVKVIGACNVTNRAHGKTFKFSKPDRDFSGAVVRFNISLALQLTPSVLCYRRSFYFNIHPINHVASNCCVNKNFLYDDYSSQSLKKFGL